MFQTNAIRACLRISVNQRRVIYIPNMLQCALFGSERNISNTKEFIEFHYLLLNVLVRALFVAKSTVLYACWVLFRAKMSEHFIGKI